MEKEMRIETGKLQVGDDWTGIFIRGDNAVNYASALKKILDGTDSMSTRMILGELRDLLKSATDQTIEAQKL